MAYNAIGGFPPQQLSFSRKNKAWRKKCVDFAESKSLIHNHLARKTYYGMKINYDLLNGKIHMDDLKAYLNPYHIDASFIPESIQHYSIINAKLKVLEGEERRRLFDWRVVVTNPNSISEIEEEKNNVANEMLQKLMEEASSNEDEFSKRLDKIAYYLQYEYQDKREVRANALLNHYVKEYEIRQMFQEGLRDAYTIGEEIYQCYISGGEPHIRKLDPSKLHILRSNISDRIEDADMIIIEEYWSMGDVLDNFWDQLSQKDVKALEETTYTGTDVPYADEMANIDPRFGFIMLHDKDWTAGDVSLPPFRPYDDMSDPHILPYDLNGNVRVLQVYWKSRRKIKKVKSYDPETGEEQFDFYPETYYIDTQKGEEEEIFWINEAWQGTKIGKGIYINMGPCPVQYNRLSNPSECHFGIIGSIYNAFGDEPFSLVDHMKPYSYLYDVLHDRLNKTLAKNVGKVIRLDFAKVPKGWDADKWLYYLNVNGIAVENSFNEGQSGVAQGKLAGGMNNATSGVVDASLGGEISQYIQILEWISNKIGELAGISKQREGQIANRETVGGVERATLQSSHITEWIFSKHDSVKKRTLECFLETAKIALRGRKKKFEYILSDGSKQIMEIDGDEFSENDYGLVCDNSEDTQKLNQNMEVLAQAALQNQLLDFSTIMGLYSSLSISEKRRLVELNEKRVKEQAQQQQQQQMQMQQQQLEQQARIAQQQQELQYKMHQEELETKIYVSEINAKAEEIRYAMIQHEDGLTRAEEAEYKQMELAQSAKEFEAKLALDKQKHEDDVKIKKEQLKVASQKAKSSGK